MIGIAKKHAPARARWFVLVAICCLAVFFVGARPEKAGHEHDASDIISGTLSDERLSENVAMDDEVLSILLDFDGPGSTLNADLLDGKNSTDFATAGHKHDASDIVSGELPDERISDAITISGDGSVAGEAVKSGTVADARLSPNVTVQGNTFNGAGQLVQLDASGRLPVVDGSQLTGLPAPVGVPRGGIIMWSGSIADIPNGWALCDGANGTPDLRDRFIVGARQDVGDVPMTNVKGSLMQTGGEHQHALSVAEMPAHVHGGVGDIAGQGGAASPHDYDAYHVWSLKQSTPVGGNQPHENCPPFFALAYIIKL